MQQLTQTRWEYVVDQARDAHELNSHLKSRGAAGWELVNVAMEQMLRTNEPVKTNRNRDNGGWYLFFKRPLEQG
jgi:hypothetical protein